MFGRVNVSQQNLNEGRRNQSHANLNFSQEFVGGEEWWGEGRGGGRERVLVQYQEQQFVPASIFLLSIQGQFFWVCVPTKVPLNHTLLLRNYKRPPVGSFIPGPAGIQCLIASFHHLQPRTSLALLPFSSALLAATLAFPICRSSFLLQSRTHDYTPRPHKHSAHRHPGGSP